MTSFEEYLIESKIDWDVGKGNWTVAKKEGAKIFKPYENTKNVDKVLHLKTAAWRAQQKGSYLGAVLLSLISDYFERLERM